MKRRYLLYSYVFHVRYIDRDFVIDSLHANKLNFVGLKTLTAYL